MCTHQRIRSQWTTANKINCVINSRYPSYTMNLTHWCLNKMTVIVKMTFWNQFSCIKFIVFSLTFQWCLFLVIQMKMVSTLVQVTINCLKQWWPLKLTLYLSVSSVYVRDCYLKGSRTLDVINHLAPVPLTVFRSNSKFDQNLQCSDLKYTLPITTKFCTRHDSYTVVTCAKFCCGRFNIF